MRINRTLKIFFVGVFLILITLKFRGKIEDFFLCGNTGLFEITRGEGLESKSLERYYATFKPFRNWEIEDLAIEALSATSVEMDEAGKKRFLFGKNTKKILPIASLTKLMTAYIAFGNYDLSQRVEISKKAAEVEGSSGFLRAGESFYLKDLLYSLLMESSNGAAQAIAEIMGENKFVELMNLKAQEWNLENTNFSNPTGLDPDNPKLLPNCSTADNLATLTFHLLKEPLIWEISKTDELELHTSDGVYHHKIENINELLGLPTEVGWEARILGGKTGQTPLAKECLLVVLENPKNKSYIINIILGSENRFEEMEKMINWIYKAYRW